MFDIFFFNGEITTYLPMWFGRSLNCLLVVLNLTLYLPEVSSVIFP